MRNGLVDLANLAAYRNIGTSDACVGDTVEVNEPGKGWRATRVIRIDDFGMYWCATWWENIWGHSTYHEPKDVMKL